MIGLRGRWGRRKMCQKITRASQGTESERCDAVWTGGRLTEVMMK